MNLAPATGTLAIGQMVCVEFSTRAGRSVRLLGCLVEATSEHLLIEGIEGSSMRPAVGETVTVSALIGRTVHSASTPVLHGGESSSRRLMLRRPVAFSDANRRRHERVTKSVPVQWFPVDDGPSSAARGQTVDLSTGGLLFTTTATAVEVGARVVVVIDCASRHIAAVADVRSARADGDGARVGVEFVAIADLDRAALAHFLA
jgi:hypothetical protein